MAELVNATRDVNIDVNVQTSYRFESYSDYINQIKFYNNERTRQMVYKNNT